MFKKGLLLLLIITMGLTISGCLDVFDPRLEVEMTLKGYLTPDQQGRVVLDLFTRNGSVEIETHQGSDYQFELEMRVAATDQQKAEAKAADALFFSEDNGELIIKVDDHDISCRIKALIPLEYYYDLKVRSSNGSISVSDLDFSNINLQTSNGSINLVGLTGEKLVAETSNGRVEIDDFFGEELRVVTSNGRIEASAQAKIIDLRTSNGIINHWPIFSAQENEITLRSSNGRINLFLEERFELGYQIDANTSNGTINMDLNDMIALGIGSYQSVDFERRSQRVFIDLATSNADINIEPR